MTSVLSMKLVAIYFEGIAQCSGFVPVDTEALGINCGKYFPKTFVAHKIGDGNRHARFRRMCSVGKISAIRGHFCPRKIEENNSQTDAL